MGKKKIKGKKKTSLSNLERKTYQILIEDRKNKIEWRKAMCELVKEDVKLHQQAYELQKQDKSNAIELFEESIINQSLKSESIQEAIPEAKNQKMDSEIAQVRYIANSILEMNEAQIKNTEEVNTLKEKVLTIESYDIQKGRQKISEIEEQLNFDDRDKIYKKTKMREMQENAFKTELLTNFDEKARAYQEKLASKLDTNIEQMAEETRWWKSSAGILSSMEASLRHSNTSMVTKMNIKRANLEHNKELSLQTSVIVEEQKREIACIEKDYSKLKEEEEMEIKLLSEQKLLVSKRESTKQNLEKQKEKLLTNKSLLRYNEYYIQYLEQKLSSSNQFADNLQKAIEEAKMIITKELTYPLMQPLNGVKKRKNILINLKTHFNKVSKLILETMQT